MKTAILLGAGSSLPAGYPSTRCLTNRVLSGNGVKRQSNGTYSKKDATLLNCMVRRLHAEAERYFSARNETPNYEDLFYLAKQALDVERGEMENPAVCPFITKLKADMSPLVEAANAENKDPNKPSYPNITDDFQALLNKTCDYISNIVWMALCRKPTSTNHLKIFVEACRTCNVTGISTLCHDTHVETHLRSEGIPLDDGFSDKKEGVRYWNGDLSSNCKIPFLKLHGSVNWFILHPDCSPLWYDDIIGIPLNGAPDSTKRDAKPQTARGNMPLLLIGTFNKDVEYSRGIFLDLHHRFRSTLREADQLVVCGYSFGDKGINTAILEWYYAKRGRRLLIIHPDRDKLVCNARAAIQGNFKDVWTDSKSIEFMASRLEDVDVVEFLRMIRFSRKVQHPSMSERRSR